MSSSAANTKPRSQLQSLDQHLQRRVEQALAASGYRALESVAAEAHEGLVTLRGISPTYHLKQLAQVVAMRTPGVELLRNEIKVVSAEAAQRLRRPCTGKGMR